MEVNKREADETTIIMLDGRLDTNTTAGAQAQIEEFLDAGSASVLLNCEQLEFISSAGLRMMLAIAKRLTASNGELKVCALNETVREVFEISGFTSLLSVFSSEAEALSC